jgi:PAS domain S-box-containing protein
MLYKPRPESADLPLPFRVSQTTAFAVAIAVALITSALVVFCRWIGIPCVASGWFAAAIILSTWFGGLGPGASTIILMLLLNRRLLPFDSAPQPGLFVLIFDAAFLCWFVAWRRRLFARVVFELLQLRRVVYWAPAAIVLLGGDRTIQFFNPAFTALYGWSLEELRGKRFPVPDSERQQWEILEETILRGGSFLNVPTRRMRKDGVEIPVLISGAPVTDAKGNPAGLVGMVLGAQPHPEVLLERERLEFLVEHSSDFICVADLNNMIHFMNHSGRAMAGIGDEDPLECSVLSLFRDQDIDTLRSKLLPLALEGEAFHTRLYLKNPQLRGHVPVFGGVTILRDSITSAPDFFVYTFQNISDLTRSEARLGRSEAAFRILLDSVPVAVALINIQGRIFETNERFQEIFGYSADELRGMLCAKLAHPDDFPRTRGIFSELISGKLDRYKVVKRLYSKAAEVIPCRMTVSLVRGDGGEPSYCICVVQPVDSTKILESRESA